MYNLYTAAYPCGLCGYLYHTLSMYHFICIPQSTHAVYVATYTISSHSTHFQCIVSFVYRVYPCGQCGYVYNFKTFHTLSMYISFVYRSTPHLRIVWTNHSSLSWYSTHFWYSTHVWSTTFLTLQLPLYFIYIPQYRQAAVCVEHCQSTHFNCHYTSCISRSIGRLRSVWNTVNPHTLIVTILHLYPAV